MVFARSVENRQKELYLCSAEVMKGLLPEEQVAAVHALPMLVARVHGRDLGVNSGRSPDTSFLPFMQQSGAIFCWGTGLRGSRRLAHRFTLEGFGGSLPL